MSHYDHARWYECFEAFIEVLLHYFGVGDIGICMAIRNKFCCLRLYKATLITEPSTESLDDHRGPMDLPVCEVIKASYATMTRTIRITSPLR